MRAERDLLVTNSTVRPTDQDGQTDGQDVGGRRLRAAPRLVSVIMPVRNTGPMVAGQLAAVAAQDHAGEWELLVVDNGCQDATLDIVAAWADRLPVVVVDARDRPGINVARNRGAARARGDLLLFCDGDDEVGPGWISAMAREATRWDLIGGRLDELTLNPPPRPSPRPRLPEDRLPLALGFLPFAPGANLGVWADVLAELGGFDERFILGNDDVELAFRAQVQGFEIGFAADAVVAYRHRVEPVAVFRQFRNYGRGEPLLYADFRSAGMTRAPWPQVIRRYGRLVLHAPRAARSPRHRGRYAITAGFTLGRLEGSLRRRVLYL